MYKIHILHDIELKIAEYGILEFGGTYKINLVSLKNIDIGQNNPQNINYSIYMGIRFLAITQPFFILSG